MRVIPSITRNWLIFFIFNAALAGISLDYLIGNKIDYWVHDAALVFQARSEWKYTGVVVLDSDIPIQVSRKQSLSLYAKATEHLIAAGAKGVYLDARLSKENEGVMPFAVCIEEKGKVRWSQPNCLMKGNQCQITNSIVGNAPLRMSRKVFPYFKVAPYLENQANLPDFLLYGWENEAFIPEFGIETLDRLVTKKTPVARWTDLSAQHVSVTMAKLINFEHVANVIHEQVPHELCDQNLPCRRVRFSYPKYTLQLSTKQPIIPLSKLASCNKKIGMETASLLKGRIAILQLTTPTEATNSIITPMTTAFFGPYMLTPGAQYIADSIETLLRNDHPREPHKLIKIILFISIAILGVLSSAYLKQLSWLWGLGVLLFGVMAALCFLSPVIQLWPVTITLMTFLIGVLQTVGLHLFIGLKEGQLILQYMPKQIHNLLFTLKPNQVFNNQRRQVIVLMSDLKNYTTITSMLNKPMHTLNLMNDYLDQTAFILQDQYEGWLETYLGDMVCYYWPYDEENKAKSYQNALRGAIELSQLQNRFFYEFIDRYKNTLEIELLRSMQQILGAGIGLSSGSVVMGDLGPRQGVRKFGILGDPMNLTSRIESLTRNFNTEIIITDDFLVACQQLALPTRRLGRYCVKGREEPALIYALGTSQDPRFQHDVITLWENWLTSLENNSLNDALSSCPEIFQKDHATLTKWYTYGLLKEGIWYLDEK